MFIFQLEGKLRFTFQGSDKPQSKHEEEQVSGNFWTSINGGKLF